MLDRLFEGQVHSNEDFKELFRAIQPLYTVERDEEKEEEKLNSIFFHYETHNYAFSINQPNYDIQDQLKTISVPVLVTVGRHDWITPVVASEDIAREIPNATLVIFENSGHSPQHEENAKFVKLVRDFLKVESDVVSTQ